MSGRHKRKADFKGIGSLRTIDLMRYSCAWSTFSEGGDTKYSVSVRYVADDQDDISGFCDVSIVQFSNGEKFDTSATYFFGFNGRAEADKECEEIVHNLVRTSVWTKFCELVKVSLAQSGVSIDNIPAAPEQVAFKRISFADLS